MLTRQSTLQLISCVLFAHYNSYALEKVLVFFNWVRKRIVSVWRRNWQEERRVLIRGEVLIAHPYQLILSLHRPMTRTKRSLLLRKLITYIAISEFI
jgi:hypothetical protein